MPKSFHESLQVCHTGGLRWDTVGALIPGILVMLQITCLHIRAVSENTKENMMINVSSQLPYWS